MKKQLFTILLAACCMSAATLTAQTAATISDQPDLTTPEMHPVNAASANFLNVPVGPYNRDLFVHSWDGTDHAEISWQVVTSALLLVTKGSLTIDHARDLDLVLYQYRGSYYVLAGFYYDGAIKKGHYYNIYEFSETGLSAISVMNRLSLNNTFGRINVDARKAGMAIAWYDAGEGVKLKAGTSPLADFGPDYLLAPLSHNYTDPDLCLNQTGGATNINIVMRSTDKKVLLFRKSVSQGCLQDWQR